jgi:hypothetical protein
MTQQIPPDLQKSIDDALVGVRNQTNTAAFPDFLLTIGNSFGHLIEKGKVLDRSQQRQLMLTILSIRHTLPVWEEAWPNDPTPQHLLREIERIVLQDFTSSQIKAVIAQINEWFKPYQKLKDQEHPTLMIGFSLFTLMDALVAIADGVIIDDRSPDQQTTMAILFAAGAYANGPIIAATFNPDKWFSFWEAWLTAIVPAAWASIPG